MKCESFILSRVLVFKYEKHINNTIGKKSWITHILPILILKHAYSYLYIDESITNYIIVVKSLIFIE